MDQLLFQPCNCNCKEKKNSFRIFQFPWFPSLGNHKNIDIKETLPPDTGNCAQTHVDDQGIPDSKIASGFRKEEFCGNTCNSHHHLKNNKKFTKELILIKESLEGLFIVWKRGLVNLPLSMQCTESQRLQSSHHQEQKPRCSVVVYQQ
jgi:hypothetical protein